MSPSPAPVGFPVQSGHYMVPAPAPMHVIQAPARRGSRLESTILSLIALIVVAVACVAGYALSRATAPTEYEAAQYQAIAEREGVFNGRIAGFNQGRQQGIAENQQIARYQGLIARAQNFNKGWRQGLKDGKNMGAYRSSGYGGYGCGYSCYYGGGYNNSYGQTSAALSTAQNLANVTGSPVDVEIY
jgi:hypothetical protein